MRIEPLDAHDPQAVKAWHDTYRASLLHGRPFATAWTLEEVRTRLTAERESEHELAFTGIVEDAVAVAGSCVLPLRDNLDHAYAEVNTHPRFRRCGYGSQMLAHIEQAARSHGRTTVLVEVAYPLGVPADGTGAADAEFLRRRGYSFGLGNVQRILELPVDEDLLRALVEEAEPHHRDYTFRQFVGRVPDDLVHSFATVLGTLMTEAPTGEIERETEDFDEARIRADEVVFEASGRTKFTTVALDGDGEVAAYSELVLPRHDPGKVYQWGTLARPQDRGHRLGLATKARNLLWAQPQLGRATLVTFNAEVNSHMIAVNEKLGFGPVERLGEFQKRLD